MKPWERHHVDSELPEVGIQLSGEPKACCDTGHCQRNKVVEISVCGGGQFESSEADVIKRLVINAVCLIGVFNELVD